MPKYEDIFSPSTIDALKGKSGESLRQMLGNKSVMQAAMRSQQLLNELAEAEEPYRDELEMVAVQMCKDAYPVLDYAGIDIDAKLVGMDDVNQNLDETINEAQQQFTPEFRRRIINGITHGAAVRGSFGFMLFREYLDQLNPALVQKYNEILKLVFGTYDDENAIAMFLQMIQMGHKQGGGSSKVIIKENINESQFNPQITIQARAICFPMLVHEIIKGLYEILSLQGFQGDKQQNQDVVNKVDKLSNEPHDLKYGKFIYDAISDVYNSSNYDDTRIREYLFTEIYKLPDDEFLPFIENAINNQLTSQQKRWADGVMRDISDDLKADDFQDI